MATSPVFQTCLFLFIALAPFQDSFLRATPLRSLGTPSFFPLLGLVALKFGGWLASGTLRVNRLFLICLAYVLATTIYGFFFFGFSSHGESLIWKSATVFVVVGLGVFAATGIDYRSTPTVRIAIYTAFFIMLLGYCFGSGNLFGLPQWAETSLFHSVGVGEFGRPRGFTTEPSVFSLSVTVLGLLSAHVARSKGAKAAILVVTVALMIASGSKGGILMLFLCMMTLCVIKWHSRWYHVAGLIFVLLPLGLSLIWLLPVLFTDTLVYETTTVPTRLSMIVCALITVGHHPFGVGLSGFLPAVGTYLPNAMGIVQSYFPLPLDFSEVTEHLTSADMVSATFFFDQLMRFGIPFVLFFGVFVFTLQKRLVERKHWNLGIAVLAAAIAVTTYIPGFGDFSISVVFGMALSEVRNWNESLS